MTTPLMHICAVCGAEEPLDALLLDLIDDDETRRLVAELLERSLPVGGLVVRYLRLHKPAKQVLRMVRVRQVLGELVPDVLRGAITRKGREWTAPMDLWRDAFAAVFDAQQKRTLNLPLDGNGYLYEIVMRLSDTAEAAAERTREADRRNRRETGARDPGAASVGELVQRAVGPAQAPITKPAPAGPSKAALRLQAEIAAALAARGGAAPTPSTEDETKEA